jgi:alkylation response protein AidB-like acyl-CoA dehydrogenase
MIDEEDLEALSESIGKVLASDADREHLHAHLDGKMALDEQLWSRAAELGWLAIGLPEEGGGLGFGARGLDALHRQLGRRVAPGPFIASLSAAQALAEAGYGGGWLARLGAGEAKLAVPALVTNEPLAKGAWLLGDTGSDAALVPIGGGDWGLVALEGAQSIELWDHSRSLFTADLGSGDPIETIDGAVSAALARHLFLALASDSIGGARAVLELTVAYMKEREQFGRPIASFQALKHRVADHMTEIVSGEEFLGLAVASAAGGNPDADIWAKLAKARCTESYLRIAQDCLQLHGGVGFTWEFDVHMYLKRARLSEMLVAPNSRLKDEAAVGLADAFAAGREPLELA